jgi:hypothetical protein
MLSATTLFIGLITGAIGLGYFIYGKKQSLLIFMLSGVVLMIYPYFLSSPWTLVGIGLCFIILPFIIKL